MADEKLREIIEWAKTKTPCASNYQCLLADLMGLLAASPAPPAPASADDSVHHCGNEGYCQACCERTLIRYFDKTLPDGDVKQMLDRLAAASERERPASEIQMIREIWDATCAPRTEQKQVPGNYWECMRCEQLERKERGLEVKEIIPLHSPRCFLRKKYPEVGTVRAHQPEARLTANPREKWVKLTCTCTQFPDVPPHWEGCEWLNAALAAQKEGRDGD